MDSYEFTPDPSAPDSYKPTDGEKVMLVDAIACYLEEQEKPCGQVSALPIPEALYMCPCCKTTWPARDMFSIGSIIPNESWFCSGCISNYTKDARGTCLADVLPKPSAMAGLIAAAYQCVAVNHFSHCDGSQREVRDLLEKALAALRQQGGAR